MTSYPHVRPQMPVQLYLLSGLVVFGLAALWLAAFHAFLQVASGPQAFFAATLIEAGLVIESLALVKRPQLWYIWLAVGISLAVSGTYNYIQAALAAPAFNPWQLGTLALGPLSALAFVSLTLGYELAEHQRRLEKWQTDRADWIEARRREVEERERQKDTELAERLERIQLREVERQEKETDRRFQLEQEDRAWRRHQEELARKRQERADAVARRTQRAESGQRSREHSELETLQPESSAQSVLVPERSPELDAFLAIIRERSGGQSFSPENVQEWTARGRTKAFEILKYGEQFGDVHRVSKGQYVNNGNHS